MSSETTVSSKPLFEWLNSQGRGAKAAFAKKLGYSESRLSMMRKRGIPKAALIDIAKAMGLESSEQYLIVAADQKQASSLLQKFISPSDADKLLDLMKTFLHANVEEKEEMLAAIQALAEEHGTKHRAENSRKRKRR